MRCHRGCAGAQVWGDTVTEGIEVDARHGDRERAVLRAAVREWSALRRHRPSRAQTVANADSSSRDGLVPEKGQEPIAEKKPEIQVHTRPLLPKISRTAAEAGVGSGPSVRGCRGPTLAGQSVCLLRIRLVARLSYTGPFPACLLAFHSRFYAVRVDPSERSTLTRAFALPQWGRPRP